MWCFFFLFLFFKTQIIVTNAGWKPSRSVAITWWKTRILCQISQSFTSSGPARLFDFTPSIRRCSHWPLCVCLDQANGIPTPEHLPSLLPLPGVPVSLRAYTAGTFSSPRLWLKCGCSRKVLPNPKWRPHISFHIFACSTQNLSMWPLTFFLIGYFFEICSKHVLKNKESTDAANSATEYREKEGF